MADLSEPTSNRTIRFVLDGKVKTVDGVAPTRSVLNYLREDLRRTGTKEGCAEGDCGACTVVVAELDGEGVRTRTVNACLQFVPVLDGKALFTVESLRQPDGSLHPVQQAMVACHGSQCGFCTPGFVMSLFGLYVEHPPRQATTGRQGSAHRADRQPLPLHRLSSDHRSRPQDVRTASRPPSTAMRCTCNCSSLRRDRGARLRSDRAPLFRAAHARPNWSHSAPNIPMRRCSPATPTSDSGSTSNCAIWATSSTPARSRNSRRSPDS